MFLIFFILPLVELLLWFLMAEVWGWWGNFLEVIISGAVGAFYIRRAGFGTLMRIQQVAQQGRSPAMELLRTLCFLLGGLLLFLPGVLSDVLGLMMVLPPTRYLMAAFMARSWLRSQRLWVRVGGMGNIGGFYTAYRTYRPPSGGPASPFEEDVIEVTAKDVREIPADNSNSSTDSERFDS